MAKIILMEDDVEQAKALGELLTILGHCVTITNDDDEALAKINGSSEYDVLITDIFTPTSANAQIERGLFLIDQVRNSTDEKTSAMPIISISGVRFTRSLAYSFDDPNAFGSDVHLSKPFGVDSLKKTIEDLQDAPPRLN